MVSEIRVNTINARSGLGTVSINDSGINVSGVVTATAFVGDGSGLTNLPNTSLITIDTAQATTSGSTVDFTGLPATVKRVTVMLNGVSTFLGSGIVRLRLLVGGSPVTSGYVGSSDNSVFTTSFTDNITDGTATRYWNLTLTQFSSTLWHCGGSMARGDIASSTSVAGAVTISGTLTGIRVDLGSGAFDAGSINIMYES